MDKTIYRLNREGTCQGERYPEALSSDYVKIDERSLIDLVKQSAEYARYVAYYGNEKKSGDWRDLFNEIYDYETGKTKFSSMEELEKEASVSPHIALFLTFLKIFGIAQNGLNELKEKHLDFYYHEILGLKPREAQPDSAVLLFELNKSAGDAIIPAGTLFAGGKDLGGKSLRYASKNNLIVNRAKISEIKGLYFKKENLTTAGRKIKMYALENIPDFGRETIINESDRFLGMMCEEEARLGFAVASPLFNLKDGTRTIRLYFQSPGEGVNFIASSFEAAYTTAGSWERVEIFASKDNICIQIASTQPAAASYDETVHQSGFETSYPVIKFIRKSNSNNLKISQLSAFRDLCVVRIRTQTRESVNIQLSNKYGNMDPKKMFFPFGAQPARESTFDITNESIFNRYLDRGSFKLNIRWKEGAPIPMPAFLSNTAGNEWISFDMQSAYCRLSLKYDFEYGSYSSKFAKAIMMEKQEDIPMLPYVPEIDYISSDFEAIDSDLDSFALFHIHPFGETKAANRRLFAPDFQQEGALLFGVADLYSPAVLSLYLRLSDYGANFDKVIAPQNYPVWYYLKGNEWVEFKKQDILLDSTGGFSKSGMVYLNIGADSFEKHTILPSTYAWLKLSFHNDSDAFPFLVGVETQAVEAAFVDDNNKTAHLERGLPANTISKPLTLIPGIRSVKQPYPSYGGRASESSKAYHTRVSEYLRHKDRAWDIWDYERLILDRFPEVYKVKCIPYSGSDTGYTPGAVLVVLIPDCNIIPQKNIFNPKVTKALINDVREFIGSRCSPFVSLQVDNPRYEEIEISCSVTLTKECKDESFYRNQLNEDLKRFLSPWAGSDRTDINFGKVLSKALIIYFIEKRPYIDYIQSLSVKVNGRKAGDDEVLRASVPNAILTSAENHYISII